MSGASVSGSATDVTSTMGRLAVGTLDPFSRLPTSSSMAWMSSCHWPGAAPCGSVKFTRQLPLVLVPEMSSPNRSGVTCVESRDLSVPLTPLTPVSSVMRSVALTC